MEKASASNNPIIGILIYSLAGGGAERFVSYLLTYLISTDHKVYLILMNSTIEFDVPKQIEVHYLEESNETENNFAKIAKIPFLAWRYSKLSKSLKITHSFSLLSRPNYINVLSKSLFGHRAKIIISERAYPSLQYGYNNLKSKLNKRLILNIYRKADSIICNSKGNAEDLFSNFNVPSKKLTIINNPIDLEKLSQIEPVRDFFDNSFFNLVSVGRLEEGKNHELLIKAVSTIDKARLYIIGKGTNQKKLEDFISAKGLQEKIFLLGFDANPFKYLKAADIFIFGSNHEGFPNVLLEAMACGLPILSTNCKSGPSDIMQLSFAPTQAMMLTKYGILVPIKDVESMQNGIAYFMENSDFRKQCEVEVKIRIQDFALNKILKQYQEKIVA